MSKRLLGLFVVLCWLAVLLPVGQAAAAEQFASPNAKEIAEWTRVIEGNGNDAVAYYKRAQAYRKDKRYDEAINDLNKALELNTKYAAAYLLRGHIYLNYKDLDSLALDDYNNALRYDAGFAVAYRNRGFIYFKRGQYDLALQDLDKAIELEPNNVTGYQAKATVFEKQSRYDEAIAMYKQALTVAPPEDKKMIQYLKDQIRALGGML